MNQDSQNSQPPPIPSVPLEARGVPPHAGHTPTASAARTGPPKPHWGFWSSLGFSAAIAGCGLVAQTAAVIVWVIAATIRGGGKSPDPHQLENDGDVLALATVLSAPVVAGLCLLFAWIKKGAPVREYLALKLPTFKQTLAWCGGLVVLMILSDLLTRSLGRPLVPDVMVDFYRSTGFLPLLWLAIVIAAPLQEELLFRGFLFRGLEHSPAGAAGAIGISAALWAGIHLQYDLYGIGTIFVLGLFLGFARWKTGSTSLCLGLHFLSNIIATIQTHQLAGQ